MAVLSKVSCPMRARLFVILATTLISGCTTYRASLSIKAIDQSTLLPVSGARVIDGRTNLQLATTPERVSLYQRGKQPMPLPLVLKTPCGYTYFTFVLIENWGAMSAPDYDVDSQVVFAVDATREGCVKLSFPP